MKRLFYAMLIVFFLLKFYYDGECISRDYDHSRITQYGVYCYAEKNVLKPYKLLRDIELFTPQPANETKVGTT